MKILLPGAKPSGAAGEAPPREDLNRCSFHLKYELIKGRRAGVSWRENLKGNAIKWDNWNEVLQPLGVYTSCFHFLDISTMFLCPRSRQSRSNRNDVSQRGKEHFKQKIDLFTDTSQQEQSGESSNHVEAEWRGEGRSAFQRLSSYDLWRSNI